MSLTRPVPKEAVLVVNAHSRKGQALFREAVDKLGEAGVVLLSAHALRDPRLLIPTVKEAVRNGAPMVIVGGGDGSLSATVDEVVDRDCVFALLPLGTANSFARTLGIPLDLDGAIATIATGQRRRIDLGMIDDDYFANCAAMGLSPMIGEGVPHNLKRYLGRLGYLIWAVWCLIRFHAFRLTVRGDGIDEPCGYRNRIANAAPGFVRADRERRGHSARSSSMRGSQPASACSGTGSPQFKLSHLLRATAPAPHRPFR